MEVLHKKIRPTVLCATLVTLAAILSAPSAYPANPLTAAARADNAQQLRQLIGSGADVNRADPDGSTPLLWAAYQSSTELVQLLLDAGADPNTPNKLGLTPLLQASRYGDAVMISALLAGGAKLSNVEFALETPLMAAARTGNIAAVRVLLDAGADPNARATFDEQTALMWAAAEGHKEMVTVLLDAGADPNLQARVSELSERKNADFPSGGFAALHWAARNGDEAMIRLLLDAGADIGVRNGDNSTPMMLAIVNDRFDIAKLLLELGADPNDGSLYYATEMHDATTDWRARDGTVLRANHPNTLSALDLTRILLNAGADPDLPVAGQMHNASMCCDIVVNATPFYRAAVAADVEALKLMLGFGADVTWKPAPAQAEPGMEAPAPKGNIGKPALMVAVDGGKGVGIAGGPGDIRIGAPPFREISNREPLDAVTVLLDAGADINARDLNQETALFAAARSGKLDILRALVARGADLNVKNKDELTALEVMEKMPPRQVSNPDADQEPIQPAEVVAVLRELAGMDLARESGSAGELVQ